MTYANLCSSTPTVCHQQSGVFSSLHLPFCCCIDLTFVITKGLWFTGAQHIYRTSQFPNPVMIQLANCILNFVPKSEQSRSHMGDNGNGIRKSVVLTDGDVCDPCTLSLSPLIRSLPMSGVMSAEDTRRFAGHTFPSTRAMTERDPSRSEI